MELAFKPRQSDSGPISPLTLMRTESVFLVLARKGLGDPVSNPAEEKVLLHLAGTRWRTGERNECKVLMELYELLGLVCILGIQFGIVRSHYFVSLTRYCPAVLVAGLSYWVFLEVLSYCSWRTKGALCCSRAQVIEASRDPSLKHRDQRDKNSMGMKLELLEQLPFPTYCVSPQY